MPRQELKEGLIGQIVSAYASKPGVSVDEIAELAVKLAKSLEFDHQEQSGAGSRALPAQADIGQRRALRHR